MKQALKRLISMGMVLTMSLGLLAGCTAQKPSGTQEPQGEDKTAGQPQPAKDTLVVATGNEPPSLSPTEHNALASIYMNLLTYNTLFAMDENMNPTPDLVDTYENTGETEWVFTLKKGVKFHDGSDLTAEDVKASLERAKTCPEVSNYTNTVATVEVVDEYTVKITTPSPSATLLYDLSNHGNAILPQELIAEGNDFSKNPIGSGPYRFLEWTSGEQLKFEAFAEYFGGAPAISQLSWAIIPEGSSRTIALEAGQVDVVLEVEPMDLERMEKDENISLLSKNSNILSWMTLNNEKPGLDNADVRRAINCAINKADVVTVANNGRGTPANAQLPQGMGGASQENADSYDLAKAKSYMAQSGVDPSTIQMSILCSSEGKRRTAEVIQANLKEIGIEVTIESIDLAAYVSATAEGNFTASIGGYSASDMVSFLKGVFHSKSIGSSNQTRTNDPAIDAAIDEIAVTLDQAQRETLIAQLAAQLNQRCPQIPLYQGENLRAYHSDLQGMNLNGAGATRFELVSWKK